MAKALLGIVVWLALACSAYAIAPEPAPKWAQLNSQQKEVLAPLSKDFDSLTDFRRKKWVGIARRYPTMKPEEQQRLQTQMRTWAGLSQDERRRARENFKKINTLPPEKKLTMKQKWEEYQRLPEAEKRRLAQSGAKPPAGPVIKKPSPPPQTVAPTPPVSTNPPAASPPAPAPAK
jgi:hypothetical protein